jgi:TRAP transporter 4TM/12TM fusion protein
MDKDMYCPTLLELMGKPVSVALKAIAIFLSLYQLYVAGVGVSSTTALRSIHLMSLMVLAIASRPAVKQVNSKGKALSFLVLDGLLILVAIASNLYLIVTEADRNFSYGGGTPIEMVLGIGLSIAILEIARRVVGLPLSITAFLLFLYAQFGHFIPGDWGHRPYSFNRIISFLYMSPEGIFGIPLGISANLVILFIIFGAFLAESGGGKFFIDFATSLIGRYRGGPAKAAVISSALFGTISGSPAANVVGTGTFTIPLMKSLGYRAEIAGAVEAVASTGGLMMPPVMGASAFLIAQYMGISYWQVCIVGFLPAILYYLSVFLVVDLEAIKLGLRGLPSSEITPLKTVVSKKGHLGIVIFVLIVLLAMRWSPQKSIFWTTMILLVISGARRETRMDVKKIVAALDAGARESMVVAVSTACAGIIVGCVMLTGLGTQFASMINSLSGGSFLPALLLAMLASLVLGCGMPPTPVYLIMAALIIPSLVKLGVEPIAAHFFVFYYSAIAGLTPPVAVTSYTAASVAKAEPMRLSYYAFFYAIPSFVLPFMMVYSPELLLQGTFLQLLRSTVTSIIGVAFVVCGLQGFFYPLNRKCSILERVVLIIAGLLLIDSGLLTDLIGIALGLMVILLDKVRKRKAFTAKENL